MEHFELLLYCSEQCAEGMRHEKQTMQIFYRETSEQIHTVSDEDFQRSRDRFGYYSRQQNALFAEAEQRYGENT